MGGCSVPGCEGDETLSFTCNECGETFCSTHRLPEAHQCHVLRSDDLSWPIVDDTDSSSGSSGPEPMDVDSLPTAKTSGDPTGSSTSSPSSSGSAHGTESSDGGRTLSSALSSVGYSLVALVGLPVFLVTFCLKTVWRYKLPLGVLAVAGLVGVALGPLSFAGVLPGDTGSDLDHALKDAGSEFEQAAANATDDSEGHTSDSEGHTSNAEGHTSDSRLNTARVERLVHERINEIRESRGLRQLNQDPVLREVASEYSRKMATEGFYSHTSPSGNTFADRYREEGYQCRVPMSENRYATGAENILYTYAFTDVRTDSGIVHYESETELAQGMVRAWMNSEGHRENILKTYWRNEGIGVYVIENPEGDGVKVYATQNFC